jgi:hypothetical protein
LIVYIDNGHAVYVGADSKRTSDSIGDIQIVCKIIRIDDKTIFFATGLTGIGHTNFSELSIIKRGFVGDSLIERIDNTLKTIKDTLIQALTRNKNNYPVDWAKRLNETRPIKTQIVICGLENNIFRGCICRFLIIKNPQIEVIPTKFYIEGFHEGSILFGDVNQDTIPASYFFSKPPARIIRELITKASKISPYVGLPINIIKITSRRIKWVQNCNCK